MAIDRLNHHPLNIFLTLLALVVLMSDVNTAQASKYWLSKSILLNDFFTDGDYKGWYTINRTWHVDNGHFILDGDYLVGVSISGSRH